MKNKLLMIIFLLLSIQLIAASDSPYPCWDKDGITSGTRLPEQSNITASVYHSPISVNPTNITFILEGESYVNYSTVNLNTYPFTYESYTTDIDTWATFTSSIHVKYVFSNLSNGIYNLSGYSTSSNGHSRPFISCKYVCSCENGPCPCAMNITNIKIGPILSPPTITIAPYLTTPTNQNITVYATTINGTLNLNNYTFTSNGNFIFISSNEEETTTTQVNITNIDKIAPVATSLTYSTTSLTNESVIATITTNEPVTGSLTHTFTSNGNYTFIFTDLAGNQGNITAHVSNIDETISALNTYNYSMKIRITYPENETYTQNVTEMRFIVDSINKTTKQCWYSNESWVSAKAPCNVDVTYSINNLGLLNGNNEWMVYVEDSMGRINSSSVIFNMVFPINNITTTNITPVTPIVPTTPVTPLPVEETLDTEAEKNNYFEDFFTGIKNNYRQILFWGLLCGGLLWLIIFIIINRRPGDKRLICVMENLVITDTNNGNVRIYSNHINDTYMDTILLTTPNEENLSLGSIGKVKIIREGKDIYRGGRALSFPIKYLFKNRKEYSHIWCYTSRASSLWSTLIKKLFNKKLIVKCDNILLDPKAKLSRKIWQYLTIKLPIKNADFVIAESDIILDKLINLTDKAHVLPNCVSVEDLSKLNLNNKKENTMISIGRLEPIKGLLDLIDAFFLFKELPGKEDWILKIIGPLNNKKYIETLKNRIIELNMQDSIFLVGPLFNKELYQEMSKAKIYIIASHPNGDGKNNTLPYTMYYGCQPIVTDVGDLRDTIAPLNIKPVPSKDVNTLAKAMKYYSKYPTEPYKLKRYIENNLDWDIYLPLFKEVFEDEKNENIIDEQKENSFSE